VSVRDLGRYDDSGVNWRVVEGYGTVIAAHGAGLPVTLGCSVRGIDWSGRRLRVETAHGLIAADAVIVTLPSALLAEQKIAFTPGLPAKAEAAAGLPPGLADKLFLSLSDAGEFEKDSRLFGRTDRSGTATYHLRPFGRPQIEAYFAATLAAELRPRAGTRSGFCRCRTGQLLGSDFARIRPLHLHRWGIDPLSRLLSTPFRARPMPCDAGRSEWTIACSSPARRAPPTTIRPRTAPISPASSRPTRRSRPGADDAAVARAGVEVARLLRATHKDFHHAQRGAKWRKPPTCPIAFIWSAASD
jgi:hypothetical protein